MHGLIQIIKSLTEVPTVAPSAPFVPPGSVQLSL